MAGGSVRFPDRRFGDRRGLGRSVAQSPRASGTVFLVAVWRSPLHLATEKRTHFALEEELTRCGAGKADSESRAGPGECAAVRLQTAQEMELWPGFCRTWSPSGAAGAPQRW